MLLSDKTAPGESSKLSHQLSILEASENAQNGQVHINIILMYCHRISAKNVPLIIKVCA